MATPQKTYPVTKANRSDGVYSTPSNEGDEFGKRKVSPSGPRKKVAKAGTIEGGEGMPGAKSSIETEAFAKAAERIASLKADKSGTQDF